MFGILHANPHIQEIAWKMTIWNILLNTTYCQMSHAHQ
jgi:hypothetical protein